MEFNKTELRVIYNNLYEARENINNEVATMDKETFDAMLIEKEELAMLLDKIHIEIKAPECVEENSIFGV